MIPFIVAAVSVIAGSAASALVGGGVVGALLGGIASVAVGYVAREVVGTGQSQPQQRVQTPIYTPPPPRIYTPQTSADYRSLYQPATAGATASAGLTQSVRQPITAHRVVYGETRLSGPLVFAHTRAPSGSSKLDILDLVLVLAGHEVDAIGQVYIQDTGVSLDGNGAATSDPYYHDGKAYFQLWKHLGAADQTADGDLVANTSGAWTSSHRLRGRAYLHARLDWDDRAWPGGIPNVSAVVRGKKLYDPRDATTAWGDNPALAVLDYLTGGYGLNCDADEIDFDSIIAAANICDETVVRPGGSEKRYTCNGAFAIDSSPDRVLPQLLSSCAGRLVNTAGVWRLYAGAWLPPTVSLSETDARDVVTVRPGRPRRQLVNTVRGTFISPAHTWQPTDYPPVSRTAYVTEDGGVEVSENLDLPFTNSPYMAQRIALITLEARRRQLTVQFPANLAGLRLVGGETVALSLARFGYVDRPMVVSSWRMNEDFGVDLDLSEEAESIYDFALEDLAEMPAAAAVSLPSNVDVNPATPTGVTATAATNAILLTWDDVAESDFDHFEVWESPTDSADPAADAVRLTEVKTTDYTRTGLFVGATRYFWVRKVDRSGNVSGWSASANATIGGSAAYGLILG
ncbi:MAG: hypothetical protein GC191_08210 [Azospirillum sp.]|nr:hypothetical protein [Azospirillum sp.]